MLKGFIRRIDYLKFFIYNKFLLSTINSLELYMYLI